MSDSKSNLGFGCLVLFLLPFFAVGVGTAVLVFIRLGQGNWAEAGFFAIFAVSFGGMASFFLFAAVRSRRQEAERESLRAQFPEEPWSWNPQWASGRIESGSKTRMVFALFFAVLWNAIAMPAPFLAWSEIAEQGEKGALLVFIFPLVGVILLGWAIREVIRHRKLGVSVLELETNPGVIGRGIRGDVYVNTPLEPFGGFRTKLVCVRRVTSGSGKNRSTSERIQWQEERQVLDSRREFNRTVIPVVFPIPADARESDDSNSRDEIVWRLELTADVPGVDLDARFDVPVFRTPESVEPLAADGRDGFGVAREQSYYEQPPDSKIAVAARPRGTEIYFPPGRNPGAAAGLTAFLLVWSAVVVVLFVVDAPLLFPIVFGFFELLLLFAALQIWFGMSRVELSSESVTVTSGMVFSPRTRRLHPKAISDIKLDVGMQSGSTPYYRITVVGSNGAKVVVARGIKDKEEAEWLVRTMKEAIDFVSQRGNGAP